MSRVVFLPLNRTAVRALRKRYRGPAYRRPIYWAGRGVGLVVAFPGAFIMYGGIVAGFLGDLWLKSVEHVLIRLERWAYPGMHETRVLVPSDLEGEPDYGKVS